MNLNEIQIEELLQGNLSDIEEFNVFDEEPEEYNLEQCIADMNEFVDDNNAHLDDLVCNKYIFIQRSLLYL